MAFGQVAADYEPAEYGDDVWIRNFKDVSTQLRILPAEGVNAKGEKVYGSEAWPTEREHFKDNLSFPCAERQGLPCPGCNDESEKVRNRSRRYYVEVYDDAGELRVWRFPSSLYATLSGREQRALAQNPENKQPLSDRDYIINKMGKGLDTKYDPEPGDKYEVDEPEEHHNIPEILEGLYNQAVTRWGDGEAAAPKRERNKDDGEYIDEIEDEPKPKAKPAKKAEPEPTRDKRKAAVEEDDSEPILAEGSTQEDFEAADTASIRAFLDATGREYPARAQRKRLIEIALEPPY